MGPPGQFELQLGHLCNDRCVFCVSGYLTSQGKAPLLDVRELTGALDRAWQAGYRRVTLLGGEPTIQPYFLDVVRHAAELGFAIVVFSNGSKPGRTDLIQQVADTGAPIEWRFSFQGGTREAHERTTRRKGSFDQLLRAVERVHALGQRITVNTCVVRQNFESLSHLPELLERFGVSQLHVDMVNPYDTGLLHAEDGAPAIGPVASHPGDLRRIDAADALSALQPRYSDLRAPLERMVSGFPPDFDVNIGGLPYCIAPGLAPWIHHGGQPTWTIAADDRGKRTLGTSLRKYVVKQTYRSKPERCEQCVFDDRCSGVFDSYIAEFGADEFVPVTAGQLEAVDVDGELFSIRTSFLLRAALDGAALPPGIVHVTIAERGRHEVILALRTSDQNTAVILSARPPPGGLAATELFSLHLTSATCTPDMLETVVKWIWRAVIGAGARGVHPPGPDIVPGRLGRPVVARLAQLRSSAPFGKLEWSRVDTTEQGIEAVMSAPDGSSAEFWIAEVGGRLRTGYRVHGVQGNPSPALIDGLRLMLIALGLVQASAAHG